MTTHHQQEMLKTKRLYLPRGRKLRYFIDTFIVSGLSLFLFALLCKGFITKEGHYNSPYFLIFLIFPAIAFLLYFHQNNSLRLHELNTNFSKQENCKLVKETLRTLQWQIKVDKKGFIEAYTDNFGIWTWADQMFSIVIADQKVLFNSICNVDTYATQAVAWGQNTRNIRRFKEFFELNAIKHIS